jgi:predicted site-specific integrase-resolvase
MNDSVRRRDIPAHRRNTMQQESPSSKLLTPRQAAQRLSITPSTLQWWRASGHNNIPFLHKDGLVYYREEDIQTFVQRVERPKKVHKRQAQKRKALKRKALKRRATR